MRFLDLALLILENLGRRKARVALTAVGVVIGTAAVVVLVSLAIGLQRNANQQLYGIGDLTQIQVMPNYGEFGGGPGMVVQAMPVGGGGQPAVQTLITDESLAEIAAIPGVTAVVPRDYVNGAVMLKLGRLEVGVGMMGVKLADLADLGLTAQSGSLALGKGTAVVGAYVSQNFYDPTWRPGQPNPTPPELMDATLKLTLIKWLQDGTEVKKSIPIRITGVIAESRGESDYSLYMTLEEVTAMNEWFMGRRINRGRDGYSMAVVKVEEVSEVLDITDQIIALGYQAYTPQSFVQGINSFYVILQVIFGGVGAIALLVAAIGIANTMAMAILERTREIGLMKAIGATNRDVLSVFLGEAAGIGFFGGLGGVLVGWSAGQVLNVLALAYLAGQSAQTGAPPPSVAVYTPLWLPVFTLIFATVIGLISGLYPALRAATLIPVNALKYE
ncbi:MAG: ABC transporter permease [Chloroflexi bacterium]|nr:ABC transporter permease [Chloroflexota bacterium]